MGLAFNVVIQYEEIQTAFLKVSPVHSCLQPAVECPRLSAVYLMPPPAVFSPVVRHR